MSTEEQTRRGNREPIVRLTGEVTPSLLLNSCLCVHLGPYICKGFNPERIVVYACSREAAVKEG